MTTRASLPHLEISWFPNPRFRAVQRSPRGDRNPGLLIRGSFNWPAFPDARSSRTVSSESSGRSHVVVRLDRIVLIGKRAISVRDELSFFAGIRRTFADDHHRITVCFFEAPISCARSIGLFRTFCELGHTDRRCAFHRCSGSTTNPSDDSTRRVTERRPTHVYRRYSIGRFVLLHFNVCLFFRCIGRVPSSGGGGFVRVRTRLPILERSKRTKSLERSSSYGFLIS